jgi:hypothetical protein
MIDPQGARYVPDWLRDCVHVVPSLTDGILLSRKLAAVAYK